MKKGIVLQCAAASDELQAYKFTYVHKKMINYANLRGWHQVSSHLFRGIVIFNEFPNKQKLSRPTNCTPENGVNVYVTNGTSKGCIYLSA